MEGSENAAVVHVVGLFFFVGGGGGWGSENEWVIPVLFLVGWDKHSVADGW